MVCDQAITPRHHLARLALPVKEYKSIGRRYGHLLAARIENNPIDAEEMIVFAVQRRSIASRQDIQPMIEIAHPQTPIGVEGKRRNVVIGKLRRSILHCV